MAPFAFQCASGLYLNITPWILTTILHFLSKTNKNNKANQDTVSKTRPQTNSISPLLLTVNTDVIWTEYLESALSSWSPGPGWTSLSLSLIKLPYLHINRDRLWSKKPIIGFMATLRKWHQSTPLSWHVAKRDLKVICRCVSQKSCCSNFWDLADISFESLFLTVARSLSWCLWRCSTRLFEKLLMM